MARQVALDLALGLGDEAQAELIAQHAGGRTDGEGAEVPDRVQAARVRAELGQARLAPGQMIAFLAGGAAAGTRVVERLRDSSAWPRYSPWAAISPA